MNRTLPAPDGTVWAQQVLAARYPELERTSHGIGFVFAPLALAHLTADITLRQRGVDVEPLTQNQARAGLILVEDTTLGARYAELLLAHIGHTLDLTWEDMTRLRGKNSTGSYRQHVKRLQAEFGVPTYELPAKPVLGTYHQHAADLLDTTLASREVNPHQRSGAVDLLTVLLFLRAHAHQPAHRLQEWVSEDDLFPALAAAEQVSADQVAPVRTLLSQHISADAGFRSAVADLVHPALLRLQFQDEEEGEGIVRCRACTGQIEPPDGAFVACPNCGEPDPTPSLRQDLIDAQNRTTP